MIDAGSVEEMDKRFREGQGDYIHQQGPYPQQLAHDGIGQVVASVGQVVGPVAFSSLCATSEWLKTDMAQAFARAFRQACGFVVETTADELARLVSEFLPDTDPEVLSNTIATYKQMGNWSADPEIDQAAYTHLLDVYLFSGLITNRHPYESCIARLP